ncbi:hypothetical protein RSAG8_09723, partial [Rhizoctonia solani AG-8 WAC10335]
MAGWWHFQVKDLHVEYMNIYEIVGLFQEADDVWRYGTEPILWIHSKKGYAYALQQPHETYKDMWNSTVTSWSMSHENISPVFRELTAPYDRPAWWPPGSDFNDLYQYIQEKITAAQTAATVVKARSKKTSASRKTPAKRKPRGRVKTRQERVKGAHLGDITPEGGGEQADGQGEGQGEIDGEGVTLEAPNNQLTPGYIRYAARLTKRDKKNLAEYGVDGASLSRRSMHEHRAGGKSCL